MFFSGHVTSHALPSYLDPGLPWQSFTRQSDQWSPARCLSGIVTRLRNFFLASDPALGQKNFEGTFILLKYYCEARTRGLGKEHGNPSFSSDCVMRIDNDLLMSKRLHHQRLSSTHHGTDQTQLKTSITRG